jgi:hypothetical protein
LPNFGVDRSIHLDNTEHGAGMRQKQHTGHTEQQSQPETLLENARHFIVALGAVQMGNDRGDGLQNANQRKNHRDMDAAANRHCRQFERR